MGPADGSQSDPGLLELFQSEMDAHIPALNPGDVGSSVRPSTSA